MTDTFATILNWVGVTPGLAHRFGYMDMCLGG